MKRWNTARGTNVENPKIDAFLKEVLEVSKKHGLSISHEDKHGAFIIEPWDLDNRDWLEEAHDGVPQ